MTCVDDREESVGDIVVGDGGSAKEAGVHEGRREGVKEMPRAFRCWDEGAT